MSRVIGIDPDLVRSGVAVVDDGEIAELLSLEFFTLVERFIMPLANNEEVLFIVEDVEANKPVFDRPKENRKKMLKIAQNVGQCKAVGRLIIQALEHYGCNYKKVKPIRGDVKRKAKEDAKYFNKFTGWTGGSNEDKRDAALLALHG